MKIAGFSFIRNAIEYDYPIEEAIRSILPLCDVVVVAVGNSEDNTRELVQSMDDSKIQIIDTVWNDNLREGGAVLAEETNKALRAVPQDADWAIYIQGDEVLHEKFYEPLLQSMQKWKDDPRVDGLLFDYLHFYGSYDYVGSSSRWYSKEIRVVRPLPNIYSYRDAQGFRKDNNKKLNVKLANATMYHYGWVKKPVSMQKKAENFNRYWHDDEWIEKNIHKASEFDYSNIDVLERFTGTHPKVMQKRIAAKNWHFDYDLSKNKYSLKEKCKKWLKKLTGYEIGEYKNYKLLRG